MAHPEPSSLLSARATILHPSSRIASRRGAGDPNTTFSIAAMLAAISSSSLRPVFQLRHGVPVLNFRCHAECSKLVCRRRPALEEVWGSQDAGFYAAVQHRLESLRGAVQSHLDGHDCGGWWKTIWPLLDRLSEPLIVLRDPAHHMLGYSALRFFRETTHLCCAREPMHRLITGHDADPCFSSAEHLGESRRIWFGHGVSVCCEYLFFPSRKSTLRESGPQGGLLIAAANTARPR